MRGAAQRTRAVGTQALEQSTHFISRNRERPLTARLLFHGVRLIYHPMPDRRQDLSVCGDVSKEQRVVRDHHVRAGSTAARAMHQASFRIERAKPPGALSRAAREVGTVYAAPANTKPVQVSRGRLTRERVDDRDRRERIGRVLIGFDLLGACQTFQAAETRVVVVPLECAERKATGKLAGESGQLLVHELVGQVVRFGGNAHRYLVTARSLRHRNQVRHGLTDTRARFDHAVRGGRQGIAHRYGHGHLLLARLVARIHPAHQATGGKILLHLGSAWHVERGQVVGIHPFGLAYRPYHL